MKEKNWIRRNAIKVAAFFATLIPGASSAQAPTTNNNTDEFVKVRTDFPTRNIDFQVDTLDNPRSIATYSSLNNSITIHYDQSKGKNYVIPEDDIATTLIHEQKHRDNKKNGMYSYGVSPDQYYMLDMHDEISANMAELVYLRDKYIKTKDISVFDCSARFNFYKEAIEKGEIVPGSMNREEFDKDMSLIINGSTAIWEKDFKSRYSSQNSYNAAISSDVSGKYAPWHQENYQTALKIAYTIGGVDFTQYMKKDIEPDDFGKKQLNYLLSQSYAYIRNQPHQYLTERFNLPQFDGKLKLSQYINLLQHTMVLNEMFMQSDSRQKGMEELARSYLMKETTAKDMQDKYNEAFNMIKKRKKTFQAFCDAIATEYDNAGKKLPKKSKDDNYIQALDDVYTAQVEVDGNVQTVNLREILNPKGDLPVKEKLEPVVSHYVKAEKNEQFPFKDVAPNYKEWQNKDGSRYSKVMHYKLIDTTKEVIYKPSSLNKDSVNRELKAEEIVAYNNKNRGY